MILLSIVLSVNFLTALCAVSNEEPKVLEHEPQVAFWCGKVNQHVDIKTGEWVTDKNGKSMCSTTEEQVLLYCRHVYPSLDVRNVVESNTPITLDKWCAPQNRNCTGQKEVTAHRCLVGSFEADALLVPKGCRFEHRHENSKCASHDDWKRRAVDKCEEQSMKLKNYGVLIPCGTGKFTGVEFVCCPKNMTVKTPKDSVHVIPLVGGSEDVDQILLKSTPRPTTFLEKMEKDIKKFSKHLTGRSIGCERKKYHIRRQKMENNHRARMSKVIKQWEGAEKRYNVLKGEYPREAEAMIKGVMERFKKTIANLENQAKLERHQLREEHHQCVQISLNDKKNKELLLFFKALKKNPPDTNAVLTSVRKFLKICTEDRIHNRRNFDFKSKMFPEKIEEFRETFQAHLKHINERVNETMGFLYKLPEVARKFYFELPTWAPKPKVLPTDRPTATATDAKSKPISVLEAKKEEDPKTPKPVNGKDMNKVGFHLLKKAKMLKHKHPHHKKPVNDPEDEPEDEEYFGEPRSPATFAVVIGLSCGALVIMIVIIIAMAMRKTRGGNPTRTVLVDPDADGDGNTEKQHLANLQQNGYANPTYKFNDI